MITRIDLTESGTAKFNSFFEKFAKDGVSAQEITFEMLDNLFDHVAIGSDLCYELGSQFTNTGRPEILSLDTQDISITEENNE